MIVCISCQIQPQIIEARKQGVVVRAVTVERDLTLKSASSKRSKLFEVYLESKRVGMRA